MMFLTSGVLPMIQKQNILYTAYGLLSFALLCTTATASSARAQSFASSPAPGFAAGNSFAANQSVPDGADSEMTIVRDNYAGAYNQSDIENLSKLYWRLGVYDAADTKAIENFIKINNCQVYQDYYNNEIEWRKIVSSMKTYLEKNRSSFPTNIQFTLQLNIGKYDVEKGGFEIINKTGFNKSKIINVKSSIVSKTACIDKSVLETYPQNALIKLKAPLDLNFIHVDEHVAQAFIIKKKNDPARNAYLRLRVTFNQYDGNLRGEEGQLFSVMDGTIDGYDVFEDSELRSVLYSQDLNQGVQAGMMSTSKAQ